MQKITNSSKAPQAVHTTRGVVYINPGKSRTVELTEPGAKLAARLKFLEISDVADQPAEAPADDDGTGSPAADLTKLRADYQELFGKRAFNGWDAEALQQKINAKLAE